jgi:DNA polymerase III delta prime subunit
MSSREYAVLFRKEAISLDYNIYLFKPVTIIEGISDAEAGVFLDELNIERGIFTDSELLLSDAEECVGYIMTEDEILQLYPNARNIEEAKVMFNDNLMDYMIMGIYDHEKDDVRVIKFNLSEMTKAIIDYKVDYNDGTVKETKKSNKLTEKKESFYDKVKESLNGQEATVLPMVLLQHIASLNDINEIKRELLNAKNNKENYEDALRNSATTVYIIPDYSIDEFLKIDDINSLKQILNFAMQSYSEMKENDKNNKPITSEEFIDSYKAIYEQLMSSTDIKMLNQYAKEASLYYKVALQELEEYDDESILLAKNFIQNEIDTLENISNMDNLQDAKKFYAATYIRNLENINQVADQLTKPQFPIDVDEEVEEEVVSESKKVDANEIIKKATTAMNELNELIGLDNVKKVFEELVKNIIFREKIKNKVEVPILNLNMVFKGNPGTGKTTVAHIISKLLCDLGYIKSNKIKECTAKDFIGQYVGQTAPKASKVIEENRGGLIFIDEAYVFAGPAQQFAQEALAEIMKELETNRTAFIFAGYSKEMNEFIELNPGIESRIGYNMDFIDYTEEQLYQMLENKFKKGKFKFDANAKETIFKMIHDAKQSKNFGNGRFIDNLYMKIYLNHVSNVYMSDDLEELVTISSNDITEELIEKPKVKKIGF